MKNIQPSEYYYPLQLIHGNKWRISFQKTPEHKILRWGDMPTRSEILETLEQTNLPVVLVSICEISASVAEYQGDFE